MAKGETETQDEDPSSSNGIKGFKNLEVREGKYVTVPAGASTVKAWWNHPAVGLRWSQEEGGVSAMVRNTVKDTLEHSHFYSELLSTSFLLDIGVGAQSYLKPSLLPQQSRVCAVDLSEAMLKRLKNNDSLVYDTFIASTATALPFNNDKFDRVLNTFMMRYLSPEDQLKAIAEMVRTSTPDSEIHIIDYDTVDYPLQVSKFIPHMVQVGLQSPKFQSRIEKIGKRINSVTSNEIQLTNSSPGTTSHLYHMILNVG